MTYIYNGTSLTIDLYPLSFYSDILQSVCDAVVNPIKKICENVVENACLQADAENDDRINVEEPGTAWIFTCPNKNWLSKGSRCKSVHALMTSHAVGSDPRVNLSLSNFSNDHFADNKFQDVITMMKKVCKKAGN